MPPADTIRVWQDKLGFLAVRERGKRFRVRGSLMEVLRLGGSLDLLVERGGSFDLKQGEEEGKQENAIDNSK